jgi:hypothetical protein
MLLLLTKELKLTTRWYSKYENSYIVTFGQLVQQIKRTDTHRQYSSISSIMIGCMGRKAKKFELSTMPCCLCVLVCLSVAFKISEPCDRLLQTTVWTLWWPWGATRRLTFQFQTLSYIKVEGKRTSEVWVLLFILHIACATRSWTNVKIYWVYIVI